MAPKEQLSRDYKERLGKGQACNQRKLENCGSSLYFTTGSLFFCSPYQFVIYVVIFILFVKSREFQVFQPTQNHEFQIHGVEDFFHQSCS